MGYHQLSAFLMYMQLANYMFFPITRAKLTDSATVS